MLEIDTGEFLGEYQVLDVLGRGSCGASYHVMSNALGKEFALKTLFLTERLSLEWIDRLEAQTALLGRLTSRHIDRIVGSGRSGGYWYCLKDFAHDDEGNSCSLKQYQQKHGGRLSHYQTYHILGQTLAGLVDAYEYEDVNHRRLCHGRLHPNNLLIVAGDLGSTVPFEVRVTDFQPFGLMSDEVVFQGYQRWSELAGGVSNFIAEEALEGVLRGIYRSYEYLAPERSISSKPTPQGDIFSVGVMVYEMLTGILPEGGFPLPTAVVPELPKFWDTVIERCLCYHPEARYQRPQQLAEELSKQQQRDMDPSFEVATDQPVKKERLSLTPKGMVYVPAGHFFVGSTECGEDAMPQHECETKGFYIDRTPVTNGQFQKFVNATGYVTEVEQGGKGPIWIDGEWRMLPEIFWGNPTGQALPEDFSMHPVTQITFADAQAYANWLGNRLPTEQEWECAARGGQKDSRFPWGDTISRANANYSNDSTCAVRQHPANGYGLFDMAGNIWEWTDSWYQPYAGNSGTNAHFGEKYRVVKGGCWMYDGSHCMVAYRNANQPSHSYPTVGFRTVKDFTQSNA